MAAQLEQVEYCVAELVNSADLCGGSSAAVYILRALRCIVDHAAAFLDVPTTRYTRLRDLVFNCARDIGVHAALTFVEQRMLDNRLALHAYPLKVVLNPYCPRTLGNWGQNVVPDVLAHLLAQADTATGELRGMKMMLVCLVLDWCQLNTEFLSERLHFKALIQHQFRGYATRVPAVSELYSF